MKSFFRHLNANAVNSSRPPLPKRMYGFNANNLHYTLLLFDIIYRNAITDSVQAVQLGGVQQTVQRGGDHQALINKFRETAAPALDQKARIERMKQLSMPSKSSWGEVEFLHNSFGVRW